MFSLHRMKLSRDVLKGNPDWAERFGKRFGVKDSVTVTLRFVEQENYKHTVHNQQNQTELIHARIMYDLLIFVN